MKVAFDIDKTLWLVDNERGKSFPNDDLVNVLKWFHKNGDDVFVWSSGGEDYAKEIVEKIGIADLVSIITKPDFGKRHPDMDLAFDDSETNLAKMNVLVSNNENDDDEDLGPKTVKEVLDLFLASYDGYNLNYISDVPKNKMDWLYRNLKREIFSLCGLPDNKMLIETCGVKTAEEAAQTITKALWEYFNKNS